MRNTRTRTTRFRPTFDAMEARLPLDGSPGDMGSVPPADVDPFDDPFASVVPMEGPAAPFDDPVDAGPPIDMDYPDDGFGPDVAPQEVPFDAPGDPNSGGYLPPVEVGPAGPAL